MRWIATRDHGVIRCAAKFGPCLIVLFLSPTLTGDWTISLSIARGQSSIPTRYLFAVVDDEAAPATIRTFWERSELLVTETILGG